MTKNLHCNYVALFFPLIDEICLDLNGYRINDQLEEVIKKFNMNKVMQCCYVNVVMYRMRKTDLK